MTELLFPSLTGTKTGCLFGDVAYMFCVSIKVLWLTSPTGTSKRLVRAEIALSLVAFLGFVTSIVNCLCYIVFGLVLARPSKNKLIWLSDAVLLFVVEWRQNILDLMGMVRIDMVQKRSAHRTYYFKHKLIKIHGH